MNNQEILQKIVAYIEAIMVDMSEDDMIAFPSDSYQEGMKTTTNPDEATPEDDGTDDTVDDNSNEDISYDENGNPVDEGVIGGADDEAGMAGDGADGDTADSVISGAGEDAGDGVDDMCDIRSRSRYSGRRCGRWYLICGTYRKSYMQGK